MWSSEKNQNIKVYYAVLPNILASINYYINAISNNNMLSCYGGVQFLTSGLKFDP